ncbi:MAG: T9SS type A sorting domain-containing protein [Bacteroidota bacterium]|nr:T9SS type A sorting domain-containing protein [Bacteroidota bacterium]
MKIISTIAVCFFPFLLSAQNYTISPSATMNIDLQLDQYNGTQVSFLNNLNRTLNLEWELISNDLVNGWDYSLCDYGTCHVGIPNSGVMDPVAEGDSGFVKMNLTPYQVDGTGQIKLIVFETGSTATPDTIIFNYNTLSTSIQNNSDLANITIFPNPTSETIFIENLNEPSTISLMDISGKTIHRIISSNKKEAIAINHLSKGIYIVSIESSKGYKQIQKVIIQ